MTNKHPWPLKNPLPEPHIPITRADLEEFLDAAGVQDSDAIWIDNYWQPWRSIAQRPVDLCTWLTTACTSGRRQRGGPGGVGCRGPATIGGRRHAQTAGSKRDHPR